MPLGGSVWIGITPEDSVQRVDLANDRVIVPQRASAFPAACIPETYAFDDAAWTAAREAQLLAECRRLAAVHGAAPAAAGGSTKDWRISDMSHKSFGELVPIDITSNRKPSLPGMALPWSNLMTNGLQQPRMPALFPAGRPLSAGSGLDQDGTTA